MPKQTANSHSPSTHAINQDTSVLVTGATGFTGRQLIKMLCDTGAHVRAIARPSSDRSSLASLPVEWIEGQVYDADVIKQAVHGTHYCFHVAAAFRSPGITDDEYRRVHVDSTQKLASAANAEPGFKRFVHVSTVGVHGHIQHPPADETSPFQPGDIYQVTKAEAENWLHAYAAEQNLSYTVIRPAGIYGPGDKRLLKVFKMAKAPVFPILGNGKCLYHLIHVEDLCRAMITAATHPNAEAEAFICGAPDSIALETMGRIIANELQTTFRPIHLPAAPFFWLADLTEAICKPLKIAPPLYRRRIAFFTKDRAFDTQKIHQKLHFECKWTNEEGLRATTQWYRKTGWL